MSVSGTDNDAASPSVTAASHRRTSREDVGRRRLSSLFRAPAEDLAAEAMHPAAAADIWSFGCLIAFLGTGEPPYADEVHARGLQLAEEQRATPGGGRSNAAAPMYALLEWTAREGHSPLARLHTACSSSAAALHSEIVALAMQCVSSAPSGRPMAVEVLTKLPRETGLFADEKVGHAKRVRIGEKYMQERSNNGRAEHGHTSGAPAGATQLMAARLPAPRPPPAAELSLGAGQRRRVHV